jgi:hypothetical protein
MERRASALAHICSDPAAAFLSPLGNTGKSMIPVRFLNSTEMR